MWFCPVLGVFPLLKGKFVLGIETGIKRGDLNISTLPQRAPAKNAIKQFLVTEKWLFWRFPWHVSLAVA